MNFCSSINGYNVNNTLAYSKRNNAPSFKSIKTEGFSPYDTDAMKFFEDRKIVSTAKALEDMGKDLYIANMPANLDVGGSRCREIPQMFDMYVVDKETGKSREFERLKLEDLPYFDPSAALTKYTGKDVKAPDVESKNPFQYMIDGINKQIG